MFEGGTNFGFMNGSNYYDELTPDVTSYDYDALLTEDGQITEKYRRYRDVIAKYREIPEVTFTTEIKRKAYGTLPVKEKVSLFSVLDDLSAPVESSFPQSMEKLGQNYGYILYHSTLDTEEKLEKLRLWEANDRANIFVDQKPVTTLYDLELLKEKELDVTFERGADFDILMENMGRVNFGPRMEHQRKGIGQCVQVNGHMHNHWKQYTLPLDNIEKVDFSKEYKEGLPGFYRFTVDIDETADTFLDFEGWGKGCVFVNGFNIGRFWEIGPQKRLFAEAVNRLLAFIRRAVVEQVEQQRAAHADNRGQERRAHAANQLIHRRQHDLGIRPRQAQAGKTHHQPQKRAEDAQRGHHTRREAGKARPPQRVNHRVFIDVLRHVAGLAVRVAHFGVLQKIRPRRGKRIAEEMHVVPRFFLFVLLAFGDDGSRRAAQSGRHAGERHGAAHQRRRRDKHNRRIDDHIHREEFLKKCKCLHICCPPK